MSIYQHFRKEEHPFIDQALSWKEQVERSYVPKLTDFLDPREQDILTSLIGTNASDVVLEFNGGEPNTERKRAIIRPYYEEMTEDMFQLTLLEAAYHQKFVSISHRDVLGAFLSLGMKRKKLGDIYISDGRIQIIVAAEIAPFVTANLNSIKRAAIHFQEQSFSSLIAKQEKWLESVQTVSSLRLDAVIKEIYRMSRSEAQALIRQERVKVNFRIVDEANFLLQKGDILSVRGKGRSKIIDIHGLTKKEKWRITTAILK